MKKDVNILENIVLNQEFMNWQLLMTKGGGGTCASFSMDILLYSNTI